MKGDKEDTLIHLASGIVS